ncbi:MULTISPECIES: response regulator [Cohaesibacter]|uniref:response regulator n=1 Tax=Cohaesibacter TaxID=655352 RepID=UPI000DEB03BE|nr:MULTISPECIES: response regulator [Cohaesibacter]TLP48699.1 response regulator [Cohaesibacter sp. CAU 1516]
MIAHSAVQPVLIVEDSDDDFEATSRAFLRTGSVKHPILRCSSGREALDFLKYGAVGEEDDLEILPGLILLDLNMPGMDGREILQIIKSDEDLKSIPVVVLTTSNNYLDVRDCYEKGANSYVTKPIELEGFVNTIASIKKFWLEVSALPRVDKND